MLDICAIRNISLHKHMHAKTYIKVGIYNAKHMKGLFKKEEGENQILERSAKRIFLALPPFSVS